MQMQKLQTLKRHLKARALARGKPGHQRGFSTTDLLMWIAIVGILLGGIYASVSTDKSRATALNTSMDSVAGAMERAKADMGCYPSVPGVLWDSTQATAANMYCGLSGLVTWSGPYLKKSPTDTTGANLMIPTQGDTAYITIAREATASTGLGYNYYIRAANIPNAVITKALQVCNGKEDATVTFSNAKCRATLGTGSTSSGTFDRLVEESH